MISKPKPVPQTSNLQEAAVKDQKEQTSTFSGSSTISGMVDSIVKNGLLTTNRYVVEIAPPKILADTQASTIKNMTMRCSSAILPGVDIASQSYRVYGPVRQMPYDILYTGQLSLTFIVSRDMSERAFLEKWMSKIVNPTEYKLGFYDDYTSTMTINILDRSDMISYKSVVQEVYPKTIGEITVANDRENEYMTQEVTFAFYKYTSTFYPALDGGGKGGDGAGAIPAKSKDGFGVGALMGKLGGRLDSIGKGLFG